MLGSIQPTRTAVTTLRLHIAAYPCVLTPLRHERWRVQRVHLRLHVRVDRRRQRRRRAHAALEVAAGRVRVVSALNGGRRVDGAVIACTRTRRTEVTNTIRSHPTQTRPPHCPRCVTAVQHRTRLIPVKQQHERTRGATTGAVRRLQAVGGAKGAWRTRVPLAGDAVEAGLTLPRHRNTETDDHNGDVDVTWEPATAMRAAADAPWLGQPGSCWTCCCRRWSSNHP